MSSWPGGDMRRDLLVKACTILAGCSCLVAQVPLSPAGLEINPVGILWMGAPDSFRLLKGSPPEGPSVFGIRLVPSEQWDGLQPYGLRHLPTAQHRPTEATVEVMEMQFKESPRSMAFGVFLGILRQGLAKTMEYPSPGFGALDLAEQMLSDPAHPEALDLARARSLPERLPGRPSGRLQPR